MDINGKADPYLVLQLGSKRVSGINIQHLIIRHSGIRKTVV